MSLEVINKAREQITEESLEIKSALATFIEETINERCTTKGVANKILDGKKTIKDLIDKITSEAKSKAKNGCAVLSDDEVREMILNYYEQMCIRDSSRPQPHPYPRVAYYLEQNKLYY